MKCLFLHNPLMLGLNKVFQSIPLVRDVVGNITDIVFKGMPQNYGRYLYCIGSVALTIAATHKLIKTWKTWEWAFSHQRNLKMLTRQNLLKKYGDCWVAITGFTEGIGWAFTNLFSQLGFNVILIGRNEEKIKLRSNFLDKKYPKTSRKYIQADLSTTEGIQKTVADLKQFSKSVEIGIFINNAGFAIGGPFLDINPQGLFDCSMVNVNAAIKFNQTIIPIFRKRNTRSALINISSCTGHYISPNVGIYSMTKKILNIYSLSLEKEYGQTIDIMTARPFGVTTKMMKMKKGPFMITPMDCARSTIADTLAGEKITYTGSKHKLTNGFLQWASEESTMQLFDDIWKKGRQQNS